MERRSFLSVVAGSLLVWLPSRKPISPWDELLSALNDGGQHCVYVRRTPDLLELFLDGKPLKTITTKCVLSITCESDFYPYSEGIQMSQSQHSALQSALRKLVKAIVS